MQHSEPLEQRRHAWWTIDVASRSPSLRYGAALLALAIATALRFGVGSLVGDKQPFITFYAVVAAAAWFGGLGPGIVALLGGLIAGVLFFVGPLGEIANASVCLGYTFVAGFLIWLAEMMHRANHRAREQTERFRLAVEATELGTWDWHIKDNLLVWDERCKAMFGFRPNATVTYQDFLNATCAEDRAEVDASVQRALEPESTGLFEIEFRSCHSDGSVRWIRSKGKVLFAQTGTGRRPIRMTGTAIDITAHKLAVAATEESESRFRTLADGAPLFIWLADNHWNIIYANRMFLDYVGVADVRGFGAKKWEEFMHPEDIAPTYQTLIRAADRQQSYNLEARMRGTVAGEYRWHLFRGNPRLLGGNLVGYMGVGIDIHDRRVAEEALRHSESRLATVIDHLGEGIVLSGAGGDLIYWNEAALKSHGYKSLEECRRRIADFRDTFELTTLEGQVLPVDQWPMSRILRGETLLNEELRLRRSDQGWIKIISYSGALLRTSTGELLASLSTFDLTQQRAAESALRQSEARYRNLSAELEERVAARTLELTHANERLKEVDRLKSEFLATMSHELRTPLNSIIGFTEILSAGLAGPINDEQKKQLGMALNSARHLLSLINDLLDLARIESGRMEPVRERFEFRDVVNEVVETLRPLASRKNLAIETTVKGDTRLYTDRKMVFQILLNLVNNALKFTEKGFVRVSAEPFEGKLRIVVTDTGIGIKSENLGMLFEAFRQVDGSARRRFEGTGLGLHLSKRLVALLGGDISIQSVFGEGSAFTVIIPVQAGANSSDS